MLAPIRGSENKTQEGFFLTVSRNTHVVNSLRGGIKLRRQQLSAQVLGWTSQNSAFLAPAKSFPSLTAHKATCGAKGPIAPGLAVS